MAHWARFNKGDKSVSEQGINEKVIEFLEAQNVGYEVRENSICVYRDAMVNWHVPSLPEQESYDLVMYELRRYVNAFFPNVKLYWGFKNDDWLMLVMYFKKG
jgi:hypothetical protein